MTELAPSAARGGRTVGRSDGQAEGERETGPVDLADLFCRHARRRVEERFEAVFDNEDAATYRVAQQVLRGEHGWLETGMVRTAAEG